MPKRLGNIIGKISNHWEEHWPLYAGSASFGLAGLILIAPIVASIINARPGPTRLVDVNEDGIKDKIIQRRVEDPYLLGLSNTFRLEEEILYGIEVGGRVLYLPREQFDTYMEGSQNTEESKNKGKG